MSTHGTGRRTLAAGLLLLAFALLVAINTAVSAVKGTATGGDVSFVALLVVAAGVAGRSLHLGARWAWWISLALAAVGLFFLLPVTGTMLLGGSLEPVGTGWDAIFFPLATADLIALAALLWLLRGEKDSSATPTHGRS
jgi:hypothetical protein